MALACAWPRSRRSIYDIDSERHADPGRAWSRAAGIAMSCSRQICSPCCASGGRSGTNRGVMHRDGWLFPEQHAMKPVKHPHNSIASSSRRHTPRRSPSRESDRTPLRHSFATHLLEDGVGISASSRSCLRHAKLENTAFYTKVATRTGAHRNRPQLDKLGMGRERSHPPAEAVRASLEVAGHLPMPPAPLIGPPMPDT